MKINPYIGFAITTVFIFVLVWLLGISIRSLLTFLYFIPVIIITGMLILLSSYAFLIEITSSTYYEESKGKERFINILASILLTAVTVIFIYYSIIVYEVWLR